jgi:hypothetical protein
MSSRLKSVIAVWFVLQVLLPFTAPLQTCVLGDLLPASSSHDDRTPLPYESNAMPLVPSTFAGSLVSSPIEMSALHQSMLFTNVLGVVMRGVRPLTFDASALSSVQLTVLRL